MKAPAKLYRYHTANYRRVVDALKQVELQGRRAVAKGDRKALKALLPLYGLLIGAAAETRLHKILFEPGAFDDAQRAEVTNEGSQFDRWKRLLAVAFRAHNSLNPKTTLTKDTLPIKDFLLYEELGHLLEHELRIIIEIRNKLAHGQWEYPLNEDCTDVLPDKKKLLNQENLLSLKFKRTIIDNLLSIMRDLTVSHGTLQRDFDVYYNRLRNARRSLANRSYEKYKRSLIEKKKRGDLERVIAVAKRNNDEIAQEAYHLYLGRVQTGAPGTNVGDWLAAEQIVLRRRAAAAGIDLRPV
jgi:hypothetical protein